MDDYCSICFDEKNVSVHTLDCGHCFHTECICNWFRRGNGGCPICRSNPFEVTEEPNIAINSYVYNSGEMKQRVSYLRRMSRKKNAPTNLKNYIKRLKKAEDNIKDIRARMSSIKNDNITVFKSWQKECTMCYRSYRNKRRIFTEIAMYDSVEYPIPH